VVSYPQLQTSIKAREMGETIAFEVQRQGATRRISVLRAADVGDPDLPLDCEAPSGEAFYLDRARDLQQRLRHRLATGPLDSIETLSVREVQVLRLVVDGATNPMIAAKLRLKRPTVARHVQNILKKLNVTTRTEAAAIGAAHGLTRDA
jgi:DNA-binding CsgD family transcriptional regulator